jgi:monoamine oxidase
VACALVQGTRRVGARGLITADAGETSILPSLQDGLRMKLARFTAGDRPSGGVDKFVGGTSRLTGAMAEALGDRVRLGHRVRRITMTNQEVMAECENGARVQAAFVIIAVPFPALRRIEVAPAFAGIQAEAVAGMRWANTSQVFLRYRGGDYWETDGFAPSLWSDGPVNLYRQLVGTDRIVAVLAGRKADALDQLPAAERGAFVVRDLEKLRPSLEGRLEPVATHSWALEPDIGGCRHDFRPGTVTRFVPAMFAPHARMHFAGEHTRLQEIGMESAMASGERAALEILAS